jgi:hypothetical protein
MKHMLTDLNTGEILICGRDGTRYSTAEVDDAEKRARRGDKDAIAIVDNVTYSEPADPQAWQEQILHDCPQCRAAMARGEKPTFGTGADLDKMLRRARILGKNPRWRDLKKRRR